ncbi:MAG: 2-amino-4-hydroxy-6-hydroxymethyldihydropteridine diphosphokinase [Phycisphaerae bacterium]|jgi:2-amino-4-hydroxy-6-hydroxymethyldihydropteridine diphosphokinase
MLREAKIAESGSSGVEDGVAKLTPTSHTAYLGLGSNLGDRLTTMRAAVTALGSHPKIELDATRDVASLYESEPVGGPPDQGHYLNSAVRVKTSLTPHELLDVVQSVESSLGRTRGERWAARTIDIDILLYDNLTINDDRLTVPHPRLHERDFVCDPLGELSGEIVPSAHDRARDWL